MATIVVNLNGGDETTTDDNLTYRVYNDTDAYVTPQSFGSHVTDANVTVSAGVATITNVTEPVGVSAFKVSSVDEAGNISTPSDAYSLDQYLFFEDFAGTVIDTNKWDIVDTGTVFTQNDNLFITTLHTDNGTFGDNYMLSKTSFDVTNNTYLGFDVVNANQRYNDWVVGLSADADPVSNQTRFCYQRTNSLTQVSTVYLDNGATIRNTNFDGDVTSTLSLKLRINSTNAYWYYWDGSVWQELTASVNNLSVLTGWKVFISARDLTSGSGSVTISNMVMTDANWTGLRP